MSAVRSLLGRKRTWLGEPYLVVIDPTETLDLFQFPWSSWYNVPSRGLGAHAKARVHWANRRSGNGFAARRTGATGCASGPF
jgi:hypothetical protein